MLKRTTSKLLRLALIVVTLVFAIEPGLAQKQPMSGGKNTAYIKMRSMTNAERRAAAQRTAQRKAAHAQKQGAQKNSSGEVKK